MMQPSEYTSTLHEHNIQLLPVTDTVTIHRNLPSILPPITLLLLSRLYQAFHQPLVSS